MTNDEINTQIRNGANLKQYEYTKRKEEYTSKPIDLLSDIDEIKQCVKYTQDNYDDEDEKAINNFLDFLEQLEYVKIKFIGEVSNKWGDKMLHNEYKVTIKRKDNSNKITFKFYNSHFDTIEGNRPSLYDVLTVFKSEIGITEEYNFDEYVDNFTEGNEDKIKEYKKQYKQLENFNEMCAKAGITSDDTIDFSS